MTNRQTTIRWWQRPLAWMAASRPGAWFFVTVAPPIDRWLMRVSRGRLSLTAGFPTLVLSTVGAKTGQVRDTPLIFLPRGDEIVLIASNGGSPRHPSWYYNLRANPEATVSIAGQTRAYQAREVTGAERDALWRQAAALYPGYLAYQRRAAGRLIPVLLLTPVQD